MLSDYIFLRIHIGQKKKCCNLIDLYGFHEKDTYGTPEAFGSEKGL